VVGAGVVPLISIEQLPDAPSLVPHLGNGAIFFADAPGGAPIRVPEASNASLDARTGWVDVRLGTIAHPEFASPLGGAYTEGRDLLPVESGERFALAAVAGRLMTSDARDVARAPRPRYAWTELPQGTTALRCEGRCSVAAFARQLPSVARDAVVRERAVGATMPMPWLIVAGVAADGPALLRLNERYDPAWWALSGTAWLTHVRVDAVSNGWIVPARAAGHVFIIDAVAAAQAGAEIAGAAWTIALMVFGWRSRLASPP
jgi:hypothetical protein